MFDNGGATFIVLSNERKFDHLVQCLAIWHVQHPADGLVQWYPYSYLIESCKRIA